MQNEFKRRFESAYEYFLNLIFTGFNNIADEVLTERVERDMAVTAADALYLCMSGHDCQWIDASFTPPQVTDDYLCYTVVKCKNIFSDKGYRTHKILKPMGSKDIKDYPLWWDVKKERFLDPKCTVIAWYKLPSGLAEHIG